MRGAGRVTTPSSPSDSCSCDSAEASFDDNEPPPAALLPLMSPFSSPRSSLGDNDSLELLLGADASIGVSPGGERSPGGGLVAGCSCAGSPVAAISPALLDLAPGLSKRAAREAPTPAVEDVLPDFFSAFTRRLSSSRTSFGWLRSIDPKSFKAGPSTAPPVPPRLSSRSSLDSSRAASPWTKLVPAPPSTPFPTPAPLPEPPAPLPPTPLPSSASLCSPAAAKSLASSAAPRSPGTAAGGDVGAAPAGSSRRALSRRAPSSFLVSGSAGERPDAPPLGPVSEPIRPRSAARSASDR